MTDGIIRLGQRTTDPSGVAGTVGIFCKGDRIFSVDASGNVTELIPSDGWINPYETWSYASATTINVSSGAANKYKVGNPIRWKQGGAYKYAYIIGVADTLLTITGGSDYTVANSAITDNYYSITSNPFGFPTNFSYTPTFTGFSINPSIVAKFSLYGNTCIVNMRAYDGTSNSTGLTISSPIQAKSIANMFWMGGAYIINAGVSEIGSAVILSGGTTFSILRYGDANYTASGTKGAAFHIEYEI